MHPRSRSPCASPCRSESAPLRDRREDIPGLVRHVLAREGLGCTIDAMEILMTRPWDGNVRALLNAVTRAAAMAGGAGRDRIEPIDVQSAETGTDTDLRTLISAALTRHGGNASHAARDLGWHRSRLYGALTRLGLDPDDFRPD